MNKTKKMELSDNQFKKVEALIRDELSDAEVITFKKEQSQNEKLRNEVAFQKGIGDALELIVLKKTISQARELNQKEALQKAEQESVLSIVKQASIENAIHKRKIKRWLQIGVAATVLLFIGLKGVPTIPDNQINNELYARIAESNFTVSEFVNVDGLNDKEALMQKAEQQYSNGKTDAALITLEKIPFEETPDQIMLTKGKLFAQQKKFSNSIIHLENASKSDHLEVRDEALYLLGIILYKQGKIKEGKNRFEQIQSKQLQEDAASFKQKLSPFEWML